MTETQNTTTLQYQYKVATRKDYRQIDLCPLRLDELYNTAIRHRQVANSCGHTQNTDVNADEDTRRLRVTTQARPEIPPGHAAGDPSQRV